MKKHIFLGFACLTALMTATSCNQDLLNIPQKGVIAYEDFYQTDDDAESALVTVYDSFVGLFNVSGGNSPAYNVFINAPGDELYWGGGKKEDNIIAQEINEFRTTFGSTNAYLTNVYKQMYKIIYKANLVIDNFWGENGELANTAVKKRCVAEARTIRAWCHMQLACYYGTPPLVDHVLPGDARPTNADKEELWQWIIKELGEAAEDLPARQGKTDKNGAVKITQGAALAFQGKAMVLYGDYAAAKTPLKRVIDSNNYGLVPGPEMRDLFHGAGDGNMEKVFELNFSDLDYYGNNGRWNFQTNQSLFFRQMKAYPDLIIQQTGWGNNMGPTKKFVDALLANEEGSYRQKAWIVSYEQYLTEFPYAKKDKKSDGTIMTREEKLMDPNRGLDFNKYNDLYANYGWFFFKKVPYQADLLNNSSVRTDQNQIIMRYAEVLLLYAEACAQTNDPSGLTYLNMVAERAGAPTYSALTMDNVKKEKWFEMAWEGCRFVDLVRWGDAATELAFKGNSETPYLFDDFYVYGTNGKQQSGNPHKAVIKWKDDGWAAKGAGFKSGKNELYPFPFDVVELNPWDAEKGVGLKQNPGWD
jgi:hypothetical protein